MWLALERRSMMSNKCLYIVVEGELDGIIISGALINTQYKKIYKVPIHSKDAMASYVRSVRLITESRDKIVVVFDADTSNLQQVAADIENMRQMSHAELFRERIEFYACVPDLEGQFAIPKSIKKTQDEYTVYLKEHKEEIQKNDLIRSIQTFIDKPNSNI